MSCVIYKIKKKIKKKDELRCEHKLTYIDIYIAI